MGLMADKYGKFPIIRVCIGLVCFSYLLLLYSNSITASFFAILILCGQQASIQNLFLSLISENVSKKLRGTGIGIYYCVIGAAYLIASQICGQLWENFGYEFAFLYGAATSIIGLIAIGMKNARARL
jgi:predicted MFS family arabinose efflux permease